MLLRLIMRKLRFHFICCHIFQKVEFWIAALCDVTKALIRNPATTTYHYQVLAPPSDTA